MKDKVTQKHLGNMRYIGTESQSRWQNLMPPTSLLKINSSKINEVLYRLNEYN